MAYPDHMKIRSSVAAVALAGLLVALACDAYMVAVCAIALYVVGMYVRTARATRRRGRQRAAGDFTWNP
jgi:hypothetical protein